MLHKELQALAEPVLEKVKEHPFWAGLRDGTLPPESLTRFVEQDTQYLLPAYARALARVAAATRWDSHAALLARSVPNTLEARDRLRTGYRDLADELDLPRLADDAQVDPACHAHCSFLHSATAFSVAAGMGALLPMIWFNYQISNDLLERHRPGTRYASWIKLYHPGENYGYAVKAYMSIYDELGDRMAVPGRTELLEFFSTSTRYEWAFAEAAWSRPTWPL
jgi:thiaminase (transcriptional activator TenA)